MVLPCIGSHDHTTFLPSALHRPDELGKMVLDLAGAETGDQRQPPRLVGRVQRVDKAQEIVGGEASGRI